MHYKNTVVCLIGLIGFSKITYASIQDELIALRAEVQSEAENLEVEKKALQTSIQSLTVEKGELESEKKLLAQAHKSYNKTLEQKNKILGNEELEDFKIYSDLIQEGLVSLEQHFEKAVPFKIEKRKARLEKIKKKFNNKELTVAEYFEKYWAVLQDEIRLSQSVEIQNDDVKINGKDYKVKILKLGMTNLYFKSHDGRLGYAMKRNDSWVFKFFENAKLSKGVSLLFAAKEKQIRGGRYSLPLFLSEEVNHVL